MQWRVGEIPQELRIENTHETEEPLREIKECNEKHNKNVPTLTLTEKQTDSTKSIVGSTITHLTAANHHTRRSRATKHPQLTCIRPRSEQTAQILTHECTLAAIESNTNAHQNFTRLLHEYSGSIMDGKTGEILEYRHLIKHPKNKKSWSHWQK